MVTRSPMTSKATSTLLEDFILNCRAEDYCLKHTVSRVYIGTKFCPRLVAKINSYDPIDWDAGYLTGTKKRNGVASGLGTERKLSVVLNQAELGI